MQPRPSKHFVLLSDPGLGIFIFAKSFLKNVFSNKFENVNKNIEDVLLVHCTRHVSKVKN